MCRPGLDTEGMRKRIQRFGLEGFQYTSYPTRFWDIFGEFGHPVRTTISEMGPLLLSPPAWFERNTNWDSKHRLPGCR